MNMDGQTAQAKRHVDAARPSDVAWRGIELCRQDDWKEGMYWLSLAAGASLRPGDLPAVYYAYLGYGLARFQNKRVEGLRLCKRAVALEFYQPDSYLFLARAHLLCNDRRAAHDVVQRGLEIDPGNDALLKLEREFGFRRMPVVRFLSRTNFINQILGRIRHRVMGARSASRR